MGCIVCKGTGYLTRGFLGRDIPCSCNTLVEIMASEQPQTICKNCVHVKIMRVDYVCTHPNVKRVGKTNCVTGKKLYVADAGLGIDEYPYCEFINKGNCKLYEKFSPLGGIKKLLSSISKK